MSEADAERLLEQYPDVKAALLDVHALIAAQEALKVRRPGDSFARTVGLFLEQTARDLLARLPQEAADAVINSARQAGQE